MKRTTKMVVYGLAVAALLGTTLAETSMAGKRGKKRPKKSARSGKYPFADAGFEPGIRKAPKSTTVKRGKKRPKKSVLGFPFSLRRKAR